jgi:hypothetical protein
VQFEYGLVERSAATKAFRWTSHRRRVLLVLGSSSATCDRTYIRQHTVQVLVLLSKSGVWPLWPIMPGHPVVWGVHWIV